jgi:hypothetical protein
VQTGRDDKKWESRGEQVCASPYHLTEIGG